MAAHDHGRPVAPVDVGDLERRLTAVATLARHVVPHLADLGGIAYEQAVGERQEGGRASKLAGHAHVDTGDRRAKQALADLEHAVVVLGRALDDAQKLVTSGPGADETLRGTLLGNERGDHAQAELGRLRKAQGRRRARGEYVPVSIVDQPDVPGASKSKGSKRKGRR